MGGVRCLGLFQKKNILDPFPKSPWAWGFFFINADKPQLCEGELLAVLLQLKRFLNFLLPLVALLADELYCLHLARTPFSPGAPLAPEEQRTMARQGC